MEMLLNRIKKNYAHLRKWARREGVEAFRVYDRDIPQYPLALDVYGKAAVLYVFEGRKQAQERRPSVNSSNSEGPYGNEESNFNGRPQNGMETHPNSRIDSPETQEPQSPNGDVGTEEDCVGGFNGIDEDGESGGAESSARSDDEIFDTEAALRSIGLQLGLEPGNIFVKSRRRRQAREQYQKLAQEKVTRVVEEQGLKFLVNLSDYLDTGLFLDHRKTRKMVRDLSSGKRVLNLFCYTGTASVYAAAGDATSVCSVDLSTTYLDWAEENFRLNGFDPQKYDFVKADALTFLARATDKFDLIFVDPPSFSNSKAMKSFFDVQLHHVDLLKACGRVLSQNGVIVFSNNLRNFKMNEQELEEFAIENITAKTLPPDFRNQKIHNAWILRKR